MFARKDIEHDVLSAYQRHGRNLKKASADFKPRGSSQPRKLKVDTEELAANVGGSETIKSPSSDCSTSYTHADNDEPMMGGRTESSDEQVKGNVEMMDHGHEAASQEEAPHV